MNTDIVNELYNNGKFLSEDYYRYWLQVADAVDPYNRDVNTEAVNGYLQEANTELTNGGVFADFETYDRIFSMVQGASIINMHEYETPGLVDIAVYGYIEDWDKVLDFSMAFKGPAHLTSTVQNIIERTLRTQGYTPLQIHVLENPGVRVFNFSITADYKVKVYYHNPFIVDDAASLVALIIAALATIAIGIVVICWTIGKVNEQNNNTKRVEYTTITVNKMLDSANELDNKANDPNSNLTPAQRQSLHDQAAKLREDAGKSLHEVTKNQGAPPPTPGIGQTVSDIGNTIMKVALVAGAAYLFIMIAPSLLNLGKQSLKRRTA